MHPKNCDSKVIKGTLQHWVFFGCVKRVIWSVLNLDIDIGVDTSVRKVAIINGFTI